jgi:hypothetical protein
MICLDHLIFDMKRKSISDDAGRSAGYYGSWWQKGELPKGQSHRGYYNSDGSPAFATIRPRGPGTAVVGPDGAIVGYLDDRRQVLIGNVVSARFRQQRRKLLLVPEWRYEEAGGRQLGSVWLGEHWPFAQMFRNRQIWHLQFEPSCSDERLRMLAAASMFFIWYEYNDTD